MINAGDTVWVLTSAGLVLLMVPGLALFYGGMVSSRNVLVMLQQNIFPLGLISLLWVMIGYSLAFGRDAGGGVIGNLDLFGLRDVGFLHLVAPGVTIPTLAFVAYMMMFAIITPALITGATANRLKFAGYVVVIGFWSVIVYAPVRTGCGARVAGGQARGGGLGGRTCGPCLCRLGGSCPAPGNRSQATVAERRDPSARGPHGRAGRRHLMVRLVRVQCR